MKARGPDLATRARRIARLRELAALLPLVGIFVFFTPALRVFDQAVTVLGAPMLFAFFFGAWIALILGTRHLARRLRDDADP